LLYFSSLNVAVKLLFCLEAYQAQGSNLSSSKHDKSHENKPEEEQVRKLA